MNNKTRKQQNPFAQISNELLNDTNLSLKAKGAYAYMYSKPDGWNFTIKSMSKQLKEGEDAIRTALLELKDYGWCEYTKHQDGTGTYDIFTSPKLENPNLENPKMGKSQRISNKEPLQRKIDNTALIELIITDLNDLTKKKFRTTTYAKTINARLKDGYTLDDFKHVHYVKYQEWNNTDQEKYLTPTTLYRPEHFDTYLNQKLKPSIKSNQLVSAGTMTAEAQTALSNFNARLNK